MVVYFKIYFILNYLLTISANSAKHELVKWPKGTYALPQSIFGCPDAENWDSGYTYHNTEDKSNSNDHSQQFHIKGKFDDQGIEQSFCVKKSLPVEDDDTSSYEWPNGTFCIYKYKKCPKGFQQGEVFWQDEKSSLQIPNYHYGAIPDGLYNLTSTLVEFCCTNTADVSRNIRLPVTKPFYLFPYLSHNCQMVEGMNVSEEWISFDDNDEGNTDYVKGTVPYGIDPSTDYNIKLYFCYYTKSEKREPIKDDIQLQAKNQISSNGKYGLTTKILIATGGVVGVASLTVVIGLAVLKANAIKALLFKTYTKL